MSGLQNLREIRYDSNFDSLVDAGSSTINRCGILHVGKIAGKANALAEIMDGITELVVVWVGMRLLLHTHHIRR